jgi:hypothetical protein
VCAVRDPRLIVHRDKAQPPRISPGRRHHWWRRGDSCSISFETGWTMPSSFIASATSRMRGVLSASCDADPSAGSTVKAVQPVYESLQGRASWPRPTPRRCQVAVASDVRVHRMSPVFTLPLRAKATIAISSRQSNPRPQALHFRLYVRSCLFGFSPHATRAAGKTLGQLTVSLNAAPRSTVQRDPVSASPGSVAQAPAGRRLSRIKRLERSCRRWQLEFAQKFNEDSCTSVRP